MDSPHLASENEFSVKLEVLGWQELIQSDCKFRSQNNHVYLKPGAYILNFTQRKGIVVPDKSTQKILTELEKAQE